MHAFLLPLSMYATARLDGPVSPIDQAKNAIKLIFTFEVSVLTHTADLSAGDT